MFIQVFLARRFFQVRVGNILSERKCQEGGVPQSSVLSGTLFALAINGVSSVIPSDILYSLFVDDLSISFAATRMATVERKIQLTIDRIIKWADMNGFKFSSSKTVVIHFCRIRGVHPDPDLYIKGQRIPCVEETHFLGLILDSKLSWVPHLKMLKIRCLKALDILKSLSHTSWGADRQTLMKLYKTLVLSKILYGCEIYSSATLPNLRILDSVHHAGIRLATGAFKSSPIPSLLVDAGELPLDLYRHSAMTRYWCRLQRMPGSLACQTTVKQTFFRYYQEHCKSPQPFSFRVRELLNYFNINNKILRFKTSTTPPWKLPEVTYCRYFLGTKRDFIDEEMRGIFMEHIINHKNSTWIFTDGSKSNAGVGFGVYSTVFNRKGALPNSASNFTAELYGILVALEKIALLENNSYTIFCDSKSALQALGVFNSVNPLVLKIQQWISLYNCRKISVEFCWVPSHVNVHGNEEADRLAKEAAVDLVVGNHSIPHQDLYPGIRGVINDIWQERWNSVGTNKMREITNVLVKWKYRNMPRCWEKALCRLRIGHTRLTHGYLMSDGAVEPYCDDCLVPLTVRHLLIECPSLEDLQKRFFSGEGGEGASYTLSSVLGEDVVYNHSGVFKYISELGILSEI